MRNNAPKAQGQTFSISQTYLTEKIYIPYLIKKSVINKDDQDTIRKITKGLCLGFALSFAAFNYIDKENWWQAVLEIISKWDGSDSALKKTIHGLPNSDKDYTLEQLIEKSWNYVYQNQAIATIPNAIPNFFDDNSQMTMLHPGSLFEILDEGRVKKIVDYNEYIMQNSLHDIEIMINKLQQEGKSICLLQTLTHVLSIWIKNGKYYFYDPFFPYPIVFYSKENLRSFLHDFFPKVKVTDFIFQLASLDKPLSIRIEKELLDSQMLWPESTLSYTKIILLNRTHNWDNLIALIQQKNYAPMAESFFKSLSQEQNEIENINSWMLRTKKEKYLQDLFLVVNAHPITAKFLEKLFITPSNEAITANGVTDIIRYAPNSFKFLKNELLKNKNLLNAFMQGLEDGLKIDSHLVANLLITQTESNSFSIITDLMMQRPDISFYFNLQLANILNSKPLYISHLCRAAENANYLDQLANAFQLSLQDSFHGQTFIYLLATYDPTSLEIIFKLANQNQAILKAVITALNMRIGDGHPSVMGKTGEELILMKAPQFANHLKTTKARFETSKAIATTTTFFQDPTTNKHPLDENSVKKIKRRKKYQ